MLVRRVVNERPRSPFAADTDAKMSSAAGREAEVPELLSRLVAWCALKIRTLVDDADLIEKRAALFDECSVAHVVRGLDVVAQGAVELLGRLANGQSHISLFLSRIIFPPIGAFDLIAAFLCAA